MFYPNIIKNIESKPAKINNNSYGNGTITATE